MRDALNVPEDDQFMTISEHDAANFRTGNAYGVTRSVDVVYIQITVFATRTANRKGAVPANRGAARRMPGYPAGGCVRDCSRRSERKLVRRPWPRAIRLRGSRMDELPQRGSALLPGSALRARRGGRSMLERPMAIAPIGICAKANQVDQGSSLRARPAVSSSRSELGPVQRTTLGFALQAIGELAAAALQEPLVFLIPGEDVLANERMSLVQKPPAGLTPCRANSAPRPVTLGTKGIGWAIGN